VWCVCDVCIWCLCVSVVCVFEYLWEILSVMCVCLSEYLS